MSGSTLTAFTYIAEGSEATPGLWNSVFSILSQNITEANSVGTIVSQISTVGVVTINANSNVTDYIHFHDTSNSRSDYLIGSFTTATADGLNLYDVSGATMIASFSKQSVRFYQNVVGPFFDIGGAVYNVKNYGATGAGVVSDDTFITAAENARVTSTGSGGVLYFPPGTYLLSQTAAASLMTIRAAGKWVGAGAGMTTLKYGGASSLATGSDFSLGAPVAQANSRPTGLGVLNVLVSGVEIADLTIDCSLKAQYAICYAQAVQSGKLNCSIISTKDKGNGGTWATWSGLNYCLSSDVPGQILSNSSVTAGLLASGIAGFLLRPDCPIQDGTDSITTYQPIHLAIIGAKLPIAEAAGGNSTTFTTGIGVAMSNNGYNCTLARLDSVGVINGLVGTAGGDTNYYTVDLLCHDVGNTVQETTGTGYSASYGFGSLNSAAPYFGEQGNLGHMFKDSSAAALYHYNVTGSALTGPNVFLSGGSSSHSGRIVLDGGFTVMDQPTLASGTTVIDATYGTMFRTNNGTATTISNITGTNIKAGKLVWIYVNDANTTIADNANLILGQGANLVAFNGQNFLFRWNGSTWNCIDWLGPLAADTVGNVAFPKQVRNASGTALLPSVTWTSEQSLGFYRSAASAVGLSYGQLQTIAGTALRPPYAFSSESSLGWYSSAASTMALSYGTLNVSNITTALIVAPGFIGQSQTFSNGSATPNVGGGTTFVTANTGATTITNFANGITGQEISVAIGDANTTLQDGANIVMGLGSNLLCFNGQVFRFRYNGTNWRVQDGPNGPWAADAVGNAVFPVQVRHASGTALKPSVAWTSEISLGWYRSGVSTMAPSYGTLNLATGAINLSMTTLAAATSAVDSGLAIVMRASGLSLVYKSGGTIYVLAASTTSGAA